TPPAAVGRSAASQPMHNAPSTVRMRALRKDRSTVNELAPVSKKPPTPALPPAPLSPAGGRRPAKHPGLRLASAAPLMIGGAAFVVRSFMHESDRGQAPTTPALASPTVPAGPEPIKVTRNRLGDAWGKPNTFASVREALARARPGDRVVLLDEFYEER